MQGPLIGITPSISCDTLDHGAFQRYVLNASYADAVAAAGGIPVVLPFLPDAANALLDRLDGVLFSGGSDLDPARFGATYVHPETYGVSPERDQFELELLDRALERDMPILCICRGIQVLNVALGGTLIQDVPSEYVTPTPIVHRQHTLGLAAKQPGHTVTLAPGSLLANRTGSDSLPVNSFHHQAIDRLGAGLEPVAHADDGLVEAVEMPGRRCVLGVQWHPELMFADHPAQLLPFLALVETAMVHATPATVAAD